MQIASGGHYNSNKNWVQRWTMNAVRASPPSRFSAEFHTICYATDRSFPAPWLSPRFSNPSPGYSFLLIIFAGANYGKLAQQFFFRPTFPFGKKSMLMLISFATELPLSPDFLPTTSPHFECILIALFPAALQETNNWQFIKMFCGLAAKCRVDAAKTRVLYNFGHLF